MSTPIDVSKEQIKLPVLYITVYIQMDPKDID